MKTEKYHGTIPTILGDAWFGSIRAAVEAADSGIECIFQVNSNHGLFPKNFIEEHLSDDPGETHSVLTGTNPQNYESVAIGYRYNSKVTLHFVITKMMALQQKVHLTK